MAKQRKRVAVQTHTRRLKGGRTTTVHRHTRGVDFTPVKLEGVTLATVGVGFFVATFQLVNAVLSLTTAILTALTVALLAYVARRNRRRIGGTIRRRGERWTRRRVRGGGRPRRRRFVRTRRTCRRSLKTWRRLRRRHVERARRPSFMQTVRMTTTPVTPPTSTSASREHPARRTPRTTTRFDANGEPEEHYVPWEF